MFETESLKKCFLKGPNSDVRYNIQSVNPASGTNLFYIFPEDGRIMVSRPLTADKENSRYVVSIPKIKQITLRFYRLFKNKILH